jgi:hypothetical protein
MERMRFSRFIAFSLAAAALLAAAIEGCNCNNDDVGTCCRAQNADAASPIPTPDPGDGGPAKNVINGDPFYNCQEEYCVAYQGAYAMCTRSCAPGNECPSGFDCQAVLMSDPGPDASIRKGDTFCVPKVCSTKADCPSDFDCVNVHPGTNQAADPAVSLCIQKSLASCMQ